jgi:hypothetical protein
VTIELLLESNCANLRVCFGPYVRDILVHTHTKEGGNQLHKISTCMSIYMFARYNSTHLPTHTHSCVCKCTLKAKTQNKTPPTHPYIYMYIYYYYLIYFYLFLFISNLCVCVYIICKCIHHMVFCSFLGVGSMMTQIKEKNKNLCVHPII